MITRRNFTLSLAALPFGLAKIVAAHAAAYPSKPIRFVVPFPAGGSTDVGARLIAESLSRAFGQRVFVENKSGANGTIGIEDAAKSAPDGYTILVTTDSVASNPHIFHTNVDPSKDLLPIIQLSRQPIVLAAHPSLGVNSLAELIVLAKKQPGLPYATGSGVGSAQHMAVQWFAQIAGITLEQVPRRRPGYQRFARWPCEAWIPWIDAADIALQGRYVALAGANFEDTFIEPSRCPNL
jgi:tripartite-type tricarboxylate transporter receptor subunit TctC